MIKKNSRSENMDFGFLKLRSGYALPSFQKARFSLLIMIKMLFLKLGIHLKKQKNCLKNQSTSLSSNHKDGKTLIPFSRKYCFFTQEIFDNITLSVGLLSK